jgi:Protein of unknown function (DUF2510)
VSDQQPPDHRADTAVGPPPGWYQDPGGQQALRWWDGTQWGPHTQPLPGMKQEFQSPQPESSRGGTRHPEGRRRSDTPARRIVGILLLIAAPVIIVAGYGTLPSANVCNTINQINTQLGEPATCSTVPAPGYFVAAGLCVVVGLLMLAPWWLRWLTGK